MVGDMFRMVARADMFNKRVVTCNKLNTYSKEEEVGSVDSCKTLLDGKSMMSRIMRRHAKNPEIDKIIATMILMSREIDRAVNIRNSMINRIRVMDGRNHRILKRPPDFERIMKNHFRDKRQDMDGLRRRDYMVNSLMADNPGSVINHHLDIMATMVRIS
jgi:hypothetical protein